MGIAVNMTQFHFRPVTSREAEFFLGWGCWRWWGWNGGRGGNLVSVFFYLLCFYVFFFSVLILVVNRFFFLLCWIFELSCEFSVWVNDFILVASVSVLFLLRIMLRKIGEIVLVPEKCFKRGVILFLNFLTYFVFFCSLRAMKVIKFGGEDNFILLFFALLDAKIHNLIFVFIHSFHSFVEFFYLQFIHFLVDQIVG